MEGMGARKSHVDKLSRIQMSEVHRKWNGPDESKGGAMITKVYLTEIPYDLKTQRVFEAWVGRGKQVSLSVMRDDNKERETIGSIRPIKLWRHSIYREKSAPHELMVLCFAVRHDENPYAKMGDFIGGGYVLSLDVSSSEVRAACVVKRTS